MSKKSKSKLKEKIIRASKHSIDFSNTGKLDKFNDFRISCAYAVNFFIDYFWHKETVINNSVFNPANNQWCCPSMASTVGIDLPDECKHLSARAVKCCVTQALGMIRAVTSKHHKRQMVNKKKQHTGKTRHLQRLIDRRMPTKPTVDIDRFKVELNSICCSFTEETNTSFFDGYITLSGIGKTYGKIYIPIKYTSRSNYWKSKAKIMNSFLCGPKNIEFRWEYETQENTSTKIVGADAGQNTVLTLSNGITTIPCRDGHTLKSINAKMARRKDESKGSQRARDHQTNHINWSVKRLNLGGYKEIRLESNKNIKKGNKTSKSLKKWSWSQIYKAITLNCEEQNVSISLQDSPYKSQRCSCCGFTHKSNRKGLVFRCLDCGFVCNSDMNSALNNSYDLAFISRSFMALKLNKSGFFWDSNGLFDLDGEALTVPLGKNVNLVLHVSS